MEESENSVEESENSVEDPENLVEDTDYNDYYDDENESMDPDDFLKSILQDPNIDYDYFIESMFPARLRRNFKNYGGDEFEEKVSQATPDKPIIISSQKHDYYELRIKDIGATNDDLDPSHIDGKIALKNNGIDLDSADDIELEFHIIIPKLKLRCCRNDGIEGPKYYSDIRTINFDILSKKGLILDCKFYTKYQCKRKIDKEGWAGSFWFQLEIENTSMQYIDYNIEAIDTYDHRYGPWTRYFHAIHKNEKVKEPVSKLEEYSGGFGSFPTKPTTIQGVIKTKFRILDLKTKFNSKDAKIKVNLGSPVSPSNPNRIPLETINNVNGQEPNVTKHDEL